MVRTVISATVLVQVSATNLNVTHATPLEPMVPVSVSMAKYKYMASGINQSFDFSVIFDIQNSACFVSLFLNNNFRYRNNYFLYKNKRTTFYIRKVIFDSKNSFYDIKNYFLFSKKQFLISKIVIKC